MREAWVHQREKNAVKALEVAQHARGAAPRRSLPEFPVLAPF